MSHFVVGVLWICITISSVNSKLLLISNGTLIYLLEYFKEFSISLPNNRITNVVLIDTICLMLPGDTSDNAVLCVRVQM